MPSIFDLPLEIREQILTDVLQDLTACLVITGSKASNSGIRSSFSICDFNKHVAKLSRRQSEPISCSLLGVCYRLRHETINLAARTMKFAVLISSVELDTSSTPVLQRSCIPPGWTIRLRNLSVTTYTLVMHHPPTFWQGFWTNVSSMCPFLMHGSVNRLSQQLQLLGEDPVLVDGSTTTKVDTLVADHTIMAKFKAEAREQYYKVISAMPPRGSRSWMKRLNLKFVVWISGVSVYGYDDFGCVSVDSSLGVLKESKAEIHGLIQSCST